MQPSSNADQFTPKWRHFHPQAVVWVLNPFQHDVIFRAADENGNQSEFRIQANERAELPGGAIATLGVKAIVDEMIQNNRDDQLHLYNPVKRKEYEDKVILRVKEAPSLTNDIGQSGPIDLSIGTSKKAKEEVQAETDKPFATLAPNPKYVEAPASKEDQIVEVD